jgi:hypothetical protein
MFFERGIITLARRSEVSDYAVPTAVMLSARELS